MASITELVKNIRNTILGKDVRESIAASIEQCYEDASKSGNANMEVTEARGTFDTLRKRLDNVDNVKAEKAELTDEIELRENIDNKLQNQINSLASGSPLVASSISEMTDTSKVYVNTTDGHWYTYNGDTWVDGGVYQATEDSKTVDKLLGDVNELQKNTSRGKILSDKLSIFNVVYHNIHNAETDLEGYSINRTNGALIKDNTNTWKATDYISVEPGKTYTNSSTLYGAYFDKNKEYVGYPDFIENTTITIPDNVYYVRTSYLIKEYGVLCEGNSIIDKNAKYLDKTLNISDNDLLKDIINIAKDAQTTTKGKKALIFGDSITQTHNVSEDGQSFTFSRTNWPTYAVEDLQLASYKNYAKDGASYKDNPTGNFYQSISNQINVAIATNSSQDVDIVIIAAGTNDGVGNVGDYETTMSKTSIEELDRSNLYDSIRWAMWSLRSAFPNAVFYVGIPTQRADKTIEYVEPMTTAIRKMAKVYDFIIVDGEAESGIVKEFENVNSEGRYLYDGLHPNDDGKKKLAHLYTNRIINTY